LWAGSKHAEFAFGLRTNNGLEGCEKAKYAGFVAASYYGGIHRRVKRRFKGKLGATLLSKTWVKYADN
jgi:hypothetical protein